MTSLPSPSPFLLLSSALQGLLGRVGGWHLRGFVGEVLVFVLYRRISLCRVRMERLIGRYLAGSLRPSQPRAAVVRDAVVGEKRMIGKRTWPARSGWLLRSLEARSWEAGQYGAQLRHALLSPEMQAILREVPQAARILGPVCRMLAIERAVFQPGFVAKARVRRDHPATRVRAPKPAADWGRIPLPRGVLTWAKRERAWERARAEVARLRKARLG